LSENIDFNQVYLEKREPSLTNGGQSVANPLQIACDGFARVPIGAPQHLAHRAVRH
jgi:hypothetical protein